MSPRKTVWIVVTGDHFENIDSVWSTKADSDARSLFLRENAASKLSASEVVSYEYWLDVAEGITPMSWYFQVFGKKLTLITEGAYEFGPVREDGSYLYVNKNGVVVGHVAVCARDKAGAVKIAARMVAEWKAHNVAGLR